MTALIDSEALQDFVREDQDMLADLASVYTRLLPDGLARMEQAVENEDTVALGEIAQQMKGRFSYFFCPSLVEIAEELESLATKDDMDKSDELLESIRAGAVELVGELAELTGLPLQIEEE